MKQEIICELKNEHLIDYFRLIYEIHSRFLEDMREIYSRSGSEFFFYLKKGFDSMDSMDVSILLLEEAPTFIFYKYLAKETQKYVNQLVSMSLFVKSSFFF